MKDTSSAQPLLVFDGDCSFCKAWVDYAKHAVGERIRFAPYQEAAHQFPHIPPEDFAKAVQLILPDGEVRSGAYAVFSALGAAPGKGWMLEFYLRAPGAAAVSEASYRTIARHRAFAYRVMRLLWGVPLEPAAFRLSSWLSLRLLGAIYLVAFASFGVQAAGLVGSRGILPVAEFLPQVRQYLGASAYWNVPTLLWFSWSDAAIKVLWIAGLCLAIAMMLGVQWRAVRIGLFLLYLSLVSASQVFLSFQWDSLLLEAGFLAIFLGSLPFVPWLFRWLLFRLMLLSGAVKLLSGDPSWRNFTALPVHYQTQPLPTALAWFFYQLPAWFQRMSLGFVFFVELLVPFLIFAPRRIRFFAASAIALLQILIFLTGNYAFFNVLTVALCLFLLDDQLLRGVFPQRLAEQITAICNPQWPVVHRVVSRVLVTLVLFVSGFQMLGAFLQFHWAPAETLISAVSPFEIVNTYGLFAVMTTSRLEIVVEGSNDGATWLPYEFKYKPGDLARRPSWVQPHQPRLDWQMWFAALGDYRSDPWTVQFMARLLAGSPDVLRLLGKNPFPGAPPHFVRAMLYEYRFTIPAERRASGNWWKRELKGSYLPPLSLRDPAKDEAPPN